MKQRKYGLQIRDEKGELLLEVGPHVMSALPKFAEQVGIITAYWAQAEINLNCLFATLLNTTPEIASAQLRKHRSTASATGGAREYAKANLMGTELDSVIEALNQLDRARTRRNRIQHDVWAIKGGDTERIFVIHANNYFDFSIKLISASAEKNDIELINSQIASAMNFAATAADGYTISDLQDIAREIDSASQCLLKLMFYFCQRSQRSSSK